MNNFIGKLNMQTAETIKLRNEKLESQTKATLFQPRASVSEGIGTLIDNFGSSNTKPKFDIIF